MQNLFISFKIKYYIVIFIKTQANKAKQLFYVIKNII